MKSALPLIGALALAANSAWAETPRFHFSIPQQSLVSSLDALARQSKLQMLFDRKALAGKTAHALNGDFTASEALGKLVNGAGLAVEYTGENAVAIRPKPANTGGNAGDKSGDTSSSLPPVVVTGSSADDKLTTHNSYTVSESYGSTKTGTPLKETPQTVQVVTRKLMDDQQSVTVTEALQNVSGVIPTNILFTPSVDNTIVRGFRSERLIDGFTQYYNAGDRESTINIGQIEVLKGSNGVLYSGGSGSPVGGVVNIVSKLPQSKAFGMAGFKLGSENFYQPFVDINQPINSNALFRINGEYTTTGSYIDSINTERYNINPSLTFTNNDTTTFTLQGRVSRWRQADYQGLPATGTISGNFQVARDMYVGSVNTPNSHADFTGVWATLDHKFTENWSFNLKARYAESEFDEKVQSLFGSMTSLDGGFVADVPFFKPSTWALVGAELYQHQTERTVMGNTLYKFDVGPTKNKFLLGFDYSKLNDDGFMDVDLGRFGMGIGSVNLAKPVFPATFSQPGLGNNNMFVINQTYGGYAQIQSTLYDRLHLLASVRLGHVDTDYENTAGKLPVINNSAKTKVLPRVGAVFDLTDFLSVFVNYSEGMRGQPFMNFASSPAPEMSENLEGGFKVNFNNEITGQIAAYQINRDNVAVTDNTDRLRRSIAAGKQRSYGVEADLMWQPTDALRLLATFAHTEAEYADNRAGVPSGNQLPGVPANSGRFWVNYDFQQPLIKGLSIGGGVYAQSGAYVTKTNAFKTDSFFTLDAAVSYEYKPFKIAATVKNLTDERYYQSLQYFGGRVVPGQGTSAFMTVSMQY